MNGPIFDAHFHIIDPRFPVQANRGYSPPAFTVDDYLTRTAGLNIVGGAVVSGSFQGFDQEYLVTALSELGSGFVGVTQLPASVSDEEIRRLDQAGVRAVRFNARRGGSESLDHLESLARRVHDAAGWHVELYIDSRELDAWTPLLLRLPSVCIDHLGLSADGLPVLLQLAERGVYIKASGFGRVDFDITGALLDFASANPGALVFGTDLPSTRAPRPFSDRDVHLVLNTLDEQLAHRVLCTNAKTLYRVTT